MPEQEHKLLRQSEFDKMCKIEQQFYIGCVVPDDFDQYEDIPETLRKIFLYQIFTAAKNNFVEHVRQTDLSKYLSK